MPTIQSFDRPTTRALTDDLLREIEGFCAARGITARFAGGTLGTTEATVKLTFTTNAAKADPSQTMEGEAWAIFAPGAGLAADMLGKSVTNGRETFRVVGWNVGAPKKPVIVERVGDGQMLRASPAWLKAQRAA